MDGTIILISTVVSAMAALASAIAAIVIVRLTSKTIKTYNEQLLAAHDQIKVTQAQTFNQVRPVLLAPANIDSILSKVSGTPLLQCGLGPDKAIVDGLQNIGTGPAFNIYGVFFGTPFRNTPPRERYVIWNYNVLPPGTPGKEITLSQGSSLRSETTIGSHTLYVPDDTQHIGCIARLTLTYHDIFGRKFASIYDYQNILGWICEEHIENLEQDLYELDQQEPATQQSNQFFYNLRKQAQP